MNVPLIAETLLGTLDGVVHRRVQPKGDPLSGSRRRLWRKTDKGSSFVAAADRISGTLLGTALGDALGWPPRGMSARVIARWFGRVERFHMLGRTGFVSDDTEQAVRSPRALRHPDDIERCVSDFRRSLFGDFRRMPWGVGRATIRACVRIGLGRRSTGVNSAWYGAAMRAAIVGVFFDDSSEQRLAFGLRPRRSDAPRPVGAVRGRLVCRS